MRTLATLACLVIPSSSFAAAMDLPTPIQIETPVIERAAVPGAQAAPMLQALASPALTPIAASQHVDALVALVLAAPRTLTPAQIAQVAALRAELPAKIAAADPQAARALAVKMDVIAATLQGQPRFVAADEGSVTADSESKGAAPLAAATVKAAPSSPAFIPVPLAVAASKPTVLNRLSDALKSAWNKLTGKKQPELGIDLSAIDSSVRPQDDFYRYTNGTWLKTYKLPGDKAEYGSFDAVHERSEAAVKAIIEGAAERAKTGDKDAAKIAGLYQSFMDTDKLEALGLKPLAEDFAAIAKVHDKESLIAAWGARMREGYGAPVGMSIDVDAKDTANYIVDIGQSGIGLPERDYYFRDDEATKKIRAAYVDYLTKLLELGGESGARAKAEKAFALEKAIAGHHWTKVDTRDADKTYNKMTVENLQKLAPGFDWAGFLRAAGVPDGPRNILVDEPSFMTGFARLFDETPVDDWKLMMKVRALSGNAGYLNKAFVDASFEYAKLFTGQTEPTPRWKKGVRLVNGVVGEMVGKLYVKDNFPDEAQKRMEALVENLRAGFAERIKGLDWMSDETKARALEKLSKFSPKIGAPKKWIDYSSLDLKADDLVGNVRRSDRFDYRRMLDKLGKPVDRGEWHMTPQTVNAYYNPVMNEIVFPAAILQAPFFNFAADDAVNYGAIGAVIGHEMSHGFDDQGAKFDGEGMMRDWWTPQDEKAFRERTAKLVGQFDGREPVPGARVNGQLTLGENIGDLGGLTVAYRAYRMSLNGKEAPVINGLTGDQRFFMGWAQVWRTIQRDEAMRQQVNTDPHSPAEYRVNVILSNMPEFYKAFGLKPGDKLYQDPEKRVGIW